MPALAVFARTPLPGRAKTRLIPLLGPRGASEFHHALILDTLRKVDAMGAGVRRYVFFEPRRFPLARRGYTLVRQRGAHLGERLDNAFRELLQRHPSVVVIGTDSPLLPLRTLREALGELRICDSVLGPCPDGGYYLIGLRRAGQARPAHGIFRAVRWGTAWAFRDTLRSLLRRGCSCSVLELCPDVDLPEDMRRLRRALARHRNLRSLAPGAWRYLRTLRTARHSTKVTLCEH
jgi:uncharacterized protein